MSLEIVNITEEALKEYEKLVSITGFGYLLADEEKGNKLQYGNQKGNILISNANKNLKGKHGMKITEHWMVFPQEIQQAISEALKAAAEDSFALPTPTFSLHTFEVLCISLNYSATLCEKMKDLSTEKLHEDIRKCLLDVGYEDDVSIFCDF